MITRLAGTLLGVNGLATEVETADGLCREVLVPAFLAERLANQTGQRVSFHTFEYHESEGQGAAYIPRLVGFVTPADRRFFDLFTTVKGIGNRKALRAMAQEPAVIARAISERNTKALQELPEIGKRMAETVIAELHGKVDPFLAEHEVSSLNARAEIKINKPKRAPAIEEAVSALVALGDTQTEAERKVGLAFERANNPAVSSGDLLDVIFAGR